MLVCSGVSLLNFLIKIWSWRLFAKVLTQETSVWVYVRVYMRIRYKTAQIPQIAAQSSTGSTVTVYRLGDHVDITRGPLISTTQQLGRFSVTAVSDIVLRRTACNVVTLLDYLMFVFYYSVVQIGRGTSFCLLTVFYYMFLFWKIDHCRIWIRCSSVIF